MGEEWRASWAVIIKDKIKNERERTSLLPVADLALHDQGQWRRFTGASLHLQMVNEHGNPVQDYLCFSKRKKGPQSNLFDHMHHN